jgi:hypothetical protein
MPDADELLKFVSPGAQLFILQFEFYFSLILRQDETDSDVFTESEAHFARMCFIPR